jgi:hypothetical protein
MTGVFSVPVMLCRYFAMKFRHERGPSRHALELTKSSVLADTRSDGRCLAERSGVSTNAVRQRSSSPLRSTRRPGTFASASCRSTNVLGVGVLRCTRGPRHRDRPVVHRWNDTPSCGMRHGRIRSARSCGSAHRCRWFAGSWPWCACDRCPRPPDRAHIHAAPAQPRPATPPALAPKPPMH